VKPLHYVELHALVSYSTMKRGLFKQAVLDYLSFCYICVLLPRLNNSILKQIYESRNTVAANRSFCNKRKCPIYCRSNHKYSNKIKVCFLTASEFNYGAFKDVLSDLKKNQFIQKPIANDELIKIVNGIITSTYHNILVKT
jgi:hypothetical protein